MTTATGPTARSVARSARGPVAGVVAVAAAALVAAALSATRTSDLLDPETYDPAGGHALSVLLADRGVRVERVTDGAALWARATSTATVFVPHPALEPDGVLARLAGLPGETVLVRPASTLLPDLGPGIVQRGVAPVAGRTPGCGLPAALRAGDADTGGATYAAPAAADACYPAGGAPTVVRLPARRLTVVGDGALFSNDRLGDRGNAALALGLLGRGDTVLWLLPDPLAARDRPVRSLNDFVPRPLKAALLALAAAVGVLALQRARRLGRPVEEPLPVVVRAAEAVEGRGRLYRAAHARDRAAGALREAALARLARRAGLAPGAAPGTVVSTLADRTGRSGPALEALLYGAPPVDDAALVRLADDLDALAREVSGT